MICEFFKKCINISGCEDIFPHQQKHMRGVAESYSSERAHYRTALRTRSDGRATGTPAAERHGGGRKHAGKGRC